MINVFLMKKSFFILFFLITSSLFAEDNFVGKKFVCAKVLWGFEFISSDKVNVISTNINNETNLEKYYYEIDNELSYINFFLIKKSEREPILSIHLDTFRVDIWTMTSGGNTTREIIPEGFCEEVKINDKDIVNFIENLKNK
tara:strand:- start:1092 stop:1517 length:426 start_codon:yes stop_codon:yes gene_type:complete